MKSYQKKQQRFELNAEGFNVPYTPRLEKHAELVKTIVEINPNTFTHGFTTALADMLWTSGDWTNIAWPCDLKHPGKKEDANTDKKLRAALGMMVNEIRGIVGGTNRVPDAYQLFEENDLVVVWEVANRQDHTDAVSKWIPLVSDLLDATGNTAFVIILCDQSGLCRIQFFETFGRGGSQREHQRLMKKSWYVDSKCPIDWKEFFS